MFLQGRIIRRGLSALPRYQPGEEFCQRAWKVVRTQDVPEFDVRAVELKHANCAAKYLHLACEDEINAFSVNFKTTPMDSTGISHILEHVTLCGSEKFPVRDPFFKMLNRSLSTFMNAMTGPDYTLYPFSTQNSRDFYNLLSVYLDAVFRPRLTEQDFRQEGWRLEQENMKDPDSALIIKGVVFNEMKGVFADPQQLFSRNILSLALPSHTYGICSGGLPEKIPELTWQKLKQFHQKHYSPHNARFLSYGNLSLSDHLDAISAYLPTTADKVFQIPVVPNEVKWTSPKVAKISCAPDPSQQTSTVALTYLACDINDSFETFVMQIIGELLIDGPNAPFYKSLLESGLGTSFAPATGYESQTKDTLFTIGLQGVLEEHQEKVIEDIRKTFQKIYEEGFEQDRIDAILHRTELSLKNKSNNFGVGLIMALTPTWNHTNGDPLQPLNVNENMERFRQALTLQPKYLQEKVKKYFIDNSHQLTLIMNPRETFVKEQQEILKKLETSLVKDIDEDGKKELFRRALELEQVQSTVEDISCLPTLKVSDIANDAPRYDLQHIVLESVPVQLSIQPTNGVSFFRALLSTRLLSPELKEVLPLFTMVLSSLGAGKFDFCQLDTEIDLRTGGLSSGIHISETPYDLHTLKEGILISSHCLERNVEKMYELWTEIFADLHYNNPERLKTLVNMLATNTMNGLVHSGHTYAMGNSSATIQPGAGIRESLGGLNNLKFLNLLAQRDSLSEVIAKFGLITKHLLNKSHMLVALNATANNSEGFVKSTQNFLQTLSGNHDGFDLTQIQDFRAENANIYYSTPFPVHFCSTSLPIVPYGHPDFAPLRIMSRLLSLKYLHTEIREKGGAYGGGVVPNSSGVLSFYSYRDPNSIATLNTFDQSSHWLRHSRFSQQDVDEAKLGVFQKIDEQVLPGSRGMREFLSGVTDDMFNKHRAALKAVTSEDILRVGLKYLDGPVRASTIIGPEPKELDSTWKVRRLV